MKNTKLIIACALAFCLASCGNQSEPKKDLQNGKTNETIVSGTPYEWNFDLLWNIFISVPDNYKPSFMLRLNDNYASVEKEMKSYFDQHPDENVLYVRDTDDDGCLQSAEIHCYKYDNADKVFVHYLKWEECEPSVNSADLSFAYDLNDGSLTEVARPIAKLGMMDFYDDILLADLSQKDKEEFKSQGEYGYSFFVEGADFLEYYYWYERELSQRSNGLAFVWNGHEFVRKPEADVCGLAIYDDGFCSLPFGSDIPEQINGFTIEPKTYRVGEEEQTMYTIKKGGELVMEIEPEIDYYTMEATNTVGVVNIYSDRYQNAEGFHVGSNINDVFEAYSDMLTTGLAPDGNLYVDLGGIEFVVPKEEFSGELPELSCDEGELIADPSFKPDAKVKMIRLYEMEY